MVSPGGNVSCPEKSHFCWEAKLWIQLRILVLCFDELLMHHLEMMPVSRSHAQAWLCSVLLFYQQCSVIILRCIWRWELHDNDSCRTIEQLWKASKWLLENVGMCRLVRGECTFNAEKTSLWLLAISQTVLGVVHFSYWLLMLCTNECSWDNSILVAGQAMQMAQMDAHPPYLASLRKESGEHLCTATLVAPTVLLTSAQCVAGGLEPIVQISRHQESGVDDVVYDAYQTIKTVIHPRFDSSRCAHECVHFYKCTSETTTTMYRSFNWRTT